MFTLGECLRSVEIIWVLWVLSTLLICWLLVHGARCWRGQTFRKLLAEEDGGAYTISYVLTFPIYFLLVCTVIESSLVLLTKMGTMYAAYCSARSAVVWLNAQPDLANDQIRSAAVNAMAPFASGSQQHAKWLGADSGSTNGARWYYGYYRYCKGPAPADYMLTKYGCALAATDVTWDPAEPSVNEPINVTLTYRMPLHIPGAARVLGAPGGFYPITTKATLPNEGWVGAENQPNYPMGIDYHTRMN